MGGKAPQLRTWQFESASNNTVDTIYNTVYNTVDIMGTQLYDTGKIYIYGLTVP